MKLHTLRCKWSKHHRCKGWEQWQKCIHQSSGITTLYSIPRWWWHALSLQLKVWRGDLTLPLCNFCREGFVHPSLCGHAPQFSLCGHAWMAAALPAGWEHKLRALVWTRLLIGLQHPLLPSIYLTGSGIHSFLQVSACLLPTWCTVLGYGMVICHSLQARAQKFSVDPWICQFQGCNLQQALCFDYVFKHAKHQLSIRLCLVGPSNCLQLFH